LSEKNYLTKIIDFLFLFLMKYFIMKLYLELLFIVMGFISKEFYGIRKRRG